MKRGVEELIRILGREGRKRELLKEIVKGELGSMVKELLEEVALVEREAFYESEGEAENGFYPRDIEGLFASVEDVKIPRTRGGGFKPFLIRPYRKASYDIEDLVIVMYQGGCSPGAVTRTIEIVQEHRYGHWRRRLQRSAGVLDCWC